MKKFPECNLRVAALLGVAVGDRFLRDVETNGLCGKPQRFEEVACEKVTSAQAKIGGVWYSIRDAEVAGNKESSFRRRLRNLGTPGLETADASSP